MWNLLIGPINEILDGSELPHKQFVSFATILVVTLWLAAIGVLPWLYMRLIVFVLQILSKRAKAVYRESLNWSVRYE